MLSSSLLLVLVLLSCAELISSGASSQRIALKRILAEWKEISQAGLALNVPFNVSDAHECGVRLSPLTSNLLEWHFSFQGMEGGPFEGGVYHGKIKLHPEYPQKAPSISMCTPSGRWEVNTDICLSATAYHQESWNPNWNLRTLVLSLRGFMISQPREIGAIHSDVRTQTRLAAASRSWRCRECLVNHEDLLSQQSNNVIGGGGKYLTTESVLIENNPSKKSQKKNKIVSPPTLIKKRIKSKDALKRTGFRSSVAKFIRHDLLKSCIPIVALCSLLYSLFK